MVLSLDEMRRRNITSAQDWRSKTPEGQLDDLYFSSWVISRVPIYQDFALHQTLQIMMDVACLTKSSSSDVIRDRMDVVADASRWIIEALDYARSLDSRFIPGPIISWVEAQEIQRIASFTTIQEIIDEQTEE